MASTRLALSAIVLCLLLTWAMAEPTGRIWGGGDVSVGKYPWVASVRVKGAHKCVGTVIRESYILTAAHCVSALNDNPIHSELVNVRVGSINQFAGGQIVDVEEIMINPHFGNFMHNIALLKLKKPLKYSNKVKAIELVSSDFVIPDDASVLVAGWGLLKSGASPYKLQETHLSVMSPPKCELKAGYGYKSTLCLSSPVSEGICKGDEGAACIYDNKLVGVMSFAFGACGTEFPDIASRIPYYNEWINEQIKA